MAIEFCGGRGQRWSVHGGSWAAALFSILGNDAGQGVAQGASAAHREGRGTHRAGGGILWCTDSGGGSPVRMQQGFWWRVGRAWLGGEGRDGSSRRKGRRGSGTGARDGSRRTACWLRRDGTSRKKARGERNRGTQGGSCAGAHAMMVRSSRDSWGEARAGRMMEEGTAVGHRRCGERLNRLGDIVLGSNSDEDKDEAAHRAGTHSWVRIAHGKQDWTDQRVPQFNEQREDRRGNGKRKREWPSEFGYGPK
jgi:hypothetical protein